MTKENQNWTKNTDVTEDQLICDCGNEVEIIHCSNWHDESGMFYTRCSCGKEMNIRWYHKGWSKPI